MDGNENIALDCVVYNTDPIDSILSDEENSEDMVIVLLVLEMLWYDCLVRIQKGIERIYTLNTENPW